MAANKGIRRYTAGEVSNLSFNNLGFDIIARGQAVPIYGIFSPPAGMVILGIVSINGVGRIMAKSEAPGADLAKDGVYNNSPGTDSGNSIMMLSADIIFGRFTKVLVFQDQLATASAYYKFILETK